MASSAEAYYLPEHGDNPVRLSSADDADALVDRLLEEPVEHSIAALYHSARPLLPAGVPDHEMYVAVDRDLKVGALMFMDASGNWASQGPEGGRTDIRYYITGNETDFPPDADISLDLVRQATKEFLANGGQRPTCVRWQPHDV